LIIATSIVLAARRSSHGRQIGDQWNLATGRTRPAVPPDGGPGIRNELPGLDSSAWSAQAYESSTRLISLEQAIWPLCDPLLDLAGELRIERGPDCQLLGHRDGSATSSF
jgi:hypothetical protein